jgi:hypothetical protein
MQSPGVSSADRKLLFEKKYVSPFDEEYPWIDRNLQKPITLLYFQWKERLITPTTKEKRMKTYNAFLECIFHDDQHILMAAKLLYAALAGHQHQRSDENDEDKEEQELSFPFSGQIVYMDLHEKMMDTGYKLGVNEQKVYTKCRLDLARHHSVHRNVQRSENWTVRDILSMLVDYVPEDKDVEYAFSIQKQEDMNQLLKGRFFNGVTILETKKYPEMTQCFDSPYAESFYYLLTNHETAWQIAHFAIQNQCPYAPFRCRWSRIMFYCAALHVLSPPLESIYCRVYGFFDVLREALDRMIDTSQTSAKKMGESAYL